MPPTQQHTFTTPTSQLLTTSTHPTRSVPTSSSASDPRQERLKRPPRIQQKPGPGRCHEFLSRPSLSDPRPPGSSSFQSWMWHSHSSLPLHPTAERETEARATRGRAAAATGPAKREPRPPPPPTSPNARTAGIPRSPAPTANHTPRQPPVPGPASPTWPHLVPASIKVSEAWNPET